MSRFRAIPYRDETELNLSSMLDVVFIMLIFFVVVATFVDESANPVALPQSTQEISDQVEAISVIVEPASTFRINGRVMPAASVRPYVQALYAENPQASFAVVVEPGSKVKDAAVAIEAGRAIGFESVPIVEH